MGLNHWGRKGLVRLRSLQRGKMEEERLGWTRLVAAEEPNCGTQSSWERQRGWESSVGMVGAAPFGDSLARSQRSLEPLRNSPTARKANPGFSSLLHSQGRSAFNSSVPGASCRDAPAPAAALRWVLPQDCQLSGE